MVSTPKTLAEELGPIIDAAQFGASSKSVSGLVSELTNEVGDLVSFLGIWSPAFDSLNLLVANFLNVNSTPVIGRGLSKEVLKASMEISVGGSTNNEDLSEKVKNFAAAFSKKEDISDNALDELRTELQESQIESLVMAIALKGYIHKLSDVIGCRRINLRKNDSVSSKFELSSFGSYIKTILELPGLSVLTKRKSPKVDLNSRTASIVLEKSTGYSWPILGQLSSKKSVKALAVVLHQNLDESKSNIGLDLKCLVALVFAVRTENEVLKAKTLRLISTLAPEITQRKLRSVVRFATADSDNVSLSFYLTNVESAALMLARSASLNPCGLNEITVSSVGSELTPEQMIEIINWVSIQEFLGRLYKYYTIID